MINVQLTQKRHWQWLNNIARRSLWTNTRRGRYCPSEVSINNIFRWIVHSNVSFLTLFSHTDINLLPVYLSYITKRLTQILFSRALQVLDLPLTYQFSTRLKVSQTISYSILILEHECHGNWVTIIFHRFMQ